jgi:hypothetical protein
MLDPPQRLAVEFFGNVFGSFELDDFILEDAAAGPAPATGPPRSMESGP